MRIERSPARSGKWLQSSDGTPAPIPMSAYLLIAGVALGLRALNAAVLHLTDVNLLSDDSNSYWNLSRYIADNAFAYVGPGSGGIPVPETERMPLYPYFLAVIRRFGGDLSAVLGVQALIDTATCLVIARMGAFWSRMGGVLAGLLAATSPILIIHSGSILTETLFLFLFSLMLLTTVSLLKKPTYGVTFASALLLGVASLARSVTVPLVAVLSFAAVVVVSLHRTGWRRGGAIVLIFLVCAAAPLALLVHRNVTVFDTPALSSQSGSHLLLWVVPLLQQEQTGEPFSVLTERLNRTADQRLAEMGIEEEDLNPMQRSAVYTSVAFDEMRSIPILVFAKVWIKASVVNISAPSILLHPNVSALKSKGLYEISGVGYIGRFALYLSENGALYSAFLVVGGVFAAVSTILSAIGLVLLARRYRIVAACALLCIAYFCLVNGPVLSPKYRLPFEPILIVLAAIALSEWIGRFARRGQGGEVDVQTR